MASTSTAVTKKVAGGSFLLQEAAPEDVFTPEDFTDEHRQIAKTADEYAINEVVPVYDRIEHKDWPLVRELLKKAGELGLTSAEIPEQYGGMDLDKISAAVLADHVAKGGSFSVSFSGHTGIGTLPIVYFGTDQQKAKYLPRLASAEWVGAYALSESSSGSDAMNIRCRATLAPDGQHYLLNGEKCWITNAGFADVYVVFAKIDGEKFTAFIVERTFPGFSVGPEEHKMGIRGSSTCPLILNDCQVPVENVLGEIGKGHIIAFNILNVGRFKLGAACVGGSREILGHAIAYAKQRKAFGKTIAEFGLIREKLAQMAAALFANEAMVYRTVGMMDAALADVDKSAADAAAQIRKGIEEYAVECSIIKVAGSEMLDFVVDEAVQIHGGYGFVEEYPVERAYRDSRVNRIFEGTNEINRLIITGWLLKRAMSGQLALMPAIKKLMDEVLSGPTQAEPLEGPLAAERAMLASARKAGLFCAGAATQKYMQAIADQQEIMGALSDMIMDVYAMDSCIARARKIAAQVGEASAAQAIAMARLYVAGAMGRVEINARKVLAAIAEGDMLRTQLMILRRLFKYEPTNSIGLQQQIADKLVETGKYVV